jgi:hypothetical protein
MNVAVVLSQKNRVLLLYPLLLIAGLFLWHGMTGFSLRDEGYLWYGAKAFLAGDFTLRDYSGYDPGRYFLVAGTMILMGDTGVLAMRLAAMLSQLGASILLMRWIIRAGMIRNVRDELIAVCFLCVLCLWMFPRHKIFDISTSMVLVVLFSWFVSNVTVRRSLLVGIGIGLVAIMGRNHGVYGLLSMGLLLPVVLFHDFTSARAVRIIGSGIIGVVVGFSPMFLFEVWKPGFIDAFLQSVLFLAEVKTTNAVLPVPWPWLVSFDEAPRQILQRLSIGIWFVALLLGGWALYIYALTIWIRMKQAPVLLLASSALAVVYTHVAFSRADPAHLAQSMAPFLVALFCVCLSLTQRLRVAVMIGLITLSAAAMVPLHPGIQCAVYTQCQTVTIAGSRVLISKDIAAEVAFFQRVHAALNDNGDGGLIVPFWPGAYALLNTRAPVWEIYPTWTRQPAFERNEIARMQARRIHYVIWSDDPMDRNDALRYSKTHPLLAAYIRSRYEDVPALSTNTFRVMKVKATQP